MDKESNYSNQMIEDRFLPSVSIVIPCRNEVKFIAKCLDSILEQDYAKDKIEILISDGMSKDGTREIISKYMKQFPFVFLLNNPEIITACALNEGINNANGEIIIIMSAHATYERDYISKCIYTLQKTNADNVGGVMVPVGETIFQKAVAFCMSHPLGVGNARFHLGNYNGYVDTVYCGCFKKDIFKKIGLFDPNFVTNEDAELNLRIIESGGKIFLNSDIKVKYYPRKTLFSLIKQYFKYGQGRFKTVKKHKKFTSFRQVLPPIWVISSLLILIMSIFSLYFLIPFIFYLIVILSVSIYGSIEQKDAGILLSAIPFIAIHYAWGTGFILGFIKK